MNVLELTRKLIEIPSPTGEEAKALHFLSGYLRDIGFNVTEQPVDDTRFNILATLGEPEVVFSTHTDTVRPLFPYSEDDRYIYGRGACDTKGILAAMILASQRLIEEGIKNFGMLLVVGEEAESDGAIAANSVPNKCRWLINGEPTENRLAVGSKGAMRVKLSVKGKACHSAYPEMGESAIEKLLDILNDIRGTEWPVHELLGKSTCNIGLISGGVQPNVVAPDAEATLLIRVSTSVEEIKAKMSQIVGNRGEVDFYFSYEPVFTHVIDGFETMIAAYGTDIPFLNNWGTPLLFGPGTILDAHTANEKIEKKQLHEAVDYFTKMVRRLIQK